MAVRAFVLARGGSLGAVQAGMLQALLSAGLVPELVVGTSAGALDGAMVAADPTVEGADRLAELWRGLHRHDVFPVDPLLASAAIPGVLPAATIDGEQLVDGTVSDNTPVSAAVRRGATEVWVIP